MDTIKLDAARMPGYTETQRLEGKSVMRLIYSTAIDGIRVQVRDAGNTEYHIEVQRDGEVVNTIVIEGEYRALSCADILRDIYYSGLDQELLAH